MIYSGNPYHLESLGVPKEVAGEENSFALFSDGACRGNPGPGAWGILGQKSSGEIIFHASGVKTSTTNNQMEMEGAIKSLAAFIDYREENSLDLQEGSRVILFSDSKYVVDGINSWVSAWKKRGWRKADKKVPNNLDLWQELDRLAQQIEELQFAWVKGHEGHPQNEYVDQLANYALDEAGY